MHTVHEISTIDMVAFGKFDQRRLLHALGRAIDEETAERLSGECFGALEGERKRLAYHRALAAVIDAHTSIRERG